MTINSTSERWFYLAFLSTVYEVCIFKETSTMYWKIFKSEQTLRPHYCRSTLMTTRLWCLHMAMGSLYSPFCWPLSYGSHPFLSGSFLQFLNRFLTTLGASIPLPVLQEVALACSHQRVANRAFQTCLCSTVGWTGHSHRWRRSSQG